MPDVILMDVSMPVMDGLEATRRIKAEMPDVRIVVLTVSDGERHLFTAIRCGASGYLPKKIEPRVLYGTLHGVAQGEAPVSPMMAMRLLEGFARRSQDPARAPATELTAREKEVLEQVARGKSNEEIAVALTISESTVRSHLRHILETLHLESRA
jgi:DNA-binding NarL/FixJ family response regulator